MRKIILAIWIGVMLAGFVDSGFSATTGVDALIEKLVEKGTLTREEGIKLKGEIAGDEDIRMKESIKDNLPGWVKDMKWKGDLRLRHQWEDKDGSEERNRERIRFRLGMESKINEQVKVAAGFATGGTDPRSTNQTLDNTFEQPDIRLNYAYAEYMPVPWLTLDGGKFPKPFWNVKDLLFDTDINFNGVGANFNGKATETVSLFFNTGVFILDESSSDTSDPFMFTLQPGLNWKVNENIGWKTAFTYYGFDNIKDSKLDNSSNSNSGLTSTGGTLTYDYDSYGIGSELAIKNVFGTPLPYFAISGEYLNNPDPSDDDQGFIIGFKLGDKKISNKRQWQFDYSYRRLEKDAFPDVFPDSDFYGGKTNVKGHEAILSFGLTKNVTLDFDYYYTEPITGTKLKEQIFQTDLNFKF